MNPEIRFLPKGTIHLLYYIYTYTIQYILHTMYIYQIDNGIIIMNTENYGIITELRRQRSEYGETEEVGVWEESIQRQSPINLHNVSLGFWPNTKLYMLRIDSARPGKEQLPGSYKVNNSQSIHRAGRYVSLSSIMNIQGFQWKGQKVCALGEGLSQPKSKVYSRLIQIQIKNEH